MRATQDNTTNNTHETHKNNIKHMIYIWVCIFQITLLCESGITHKIQSFALALARVHL